MLHGLRTEARVPSFGSYLLGAAQLVVLAAGFGLAAYWLRARLLPGWRGAPARLVEVDRRGRPADRRQRGPRHLRAALRGRAADRAPSSSPSRRASSRPRAGEGRRRAAASSASGPSLVAIAVIAIVVFDWAVTAKHALDTGIFNFDSLWYHMPFSADIAQSHSTTGMHHVETVFVNWFYPQNSELLHAVGILMIGRDTLSLFINFGWLAVAFLAAYCVGRPYGRGIPAVIAAAILVGCHTLVVREPGAAKNDLMAAALLLAGIAILIEAWNAQPDADAADAADEFAETRAMRGEVRTRALYGWPLAAAGLAVGLGGRDAAHVFALAAALSVVVLVLAPAGKRWKAAGWWFVARPARRRLLVPAQPDRRRQPDPRGDQASARSPCPIPNACRKAAPASASPTTSPTPASGATTSRPGLHDAFGAALAAGPGRRRRRLPAGDLLRPRQADPLARRRRPLRASSPTSSRRSARPGRRANRSASRSTSATSSRRCWRRSSWCRCRASSTRRSASGG